MLEKLSPESSYVERIIEDKIQKIVFIKNIYLSVKQDNQNVKKTYYAVMSDKGGMISFFETMVLAKYFCITKNLSYNIAM